MSLNIIDLIKGQLGPALVTQAATQLGESESGISKAINGLLPAVLGGLANNSSSSTVLDSIVGANSNGLLSNLLGGTSGNSIITSVITSIFGDKVSGLLNLISGYSGVKTSSADSLLNIVTGAALGSVGKYAVDNNLDRNGISSLLNDQKGVISSLLPAGLSLGTLGLGNLFGNSTTIETPKVTVEESHTASPKVTVAEATTKPKPITQKEDKDGGSIFKWLLPLVLLLLAGWFLWKQCDSKTTTVETSENVDTITTTTTTEEVVTRESMVVTLPNGVKLDAFKGGIEDQIVNFLNSEEYAKATAEELKDKWFNFDNLNFEFASTKLTPESEIQMDNLKAILEAYPNAKIKIGAYTDKKGDDTANLKLSQDRADAVKTRLASAQVVEAEGYGEKFATVDENASDKEREADRKTSIRFVK